MPPRNSLTILVAVFVSLACHRQAAHNRFAATLADAMGQIRNQYIDAVDQRTLFEHAMDGMVRELDPYSSFIPPREYVRWKEELDQQFGGIGVMIRPDPTTQRPMVTSPVVDSPAFRAGIRAGDLIMAVDGVDTDGLTTDEIVNQVKGQPGTAVTLTIQPFGQQETVTHSLIRAVVPIESVLGDLRRADGTWEYRLVEHPGIGYIRLVRFGEQTATELEIALQSVTSDISSLILDLRGNEGGLLSAAVDTCDFFLSDGDIVREQGRDRQLVRRYRARPGNDLVSPELPLAILVDHFAASASEIVAACLQDHRRAVVIGQRTWGKGTVQRLIELEGGRSALRLTTATYWRPSGRNIHRAANAADGDEWGVSPDQGFEVVLDRDQYIEMLEQRRDRDGVSLSADGDAPPFRDAQLARAIEFLRSPREVLAQQASNEPMLHRGFP